VLVGTTSVEISELLSRMLGMAKIKHQVLNAKLHQSEAEIVANAGKAGAVTIATNMAGRGTDIKLGEGVIAAGGLAIIGTERHDSRRVDRQLRGRAGRQGDPGSSQFFVSLEDKLMRLFGSERIAKMMDRLGLKEGEVIQHKMITKSIERAQKKVEENNFGIRKNLLEYDDVMNAQRTAVYKRRKNALYGDRLSLDLDNSFYDLTDALVYGYQETGDYDGYKLEVVKTFGLDTQVIEDDFIDGKPEEISGELFEEAILAYRRRSQRLREQALLIVQNVADNQEGFLNVVLPITDGRKGTKFVVNIEETIETKGAAVVSQVERSLTLAIIDEEWKEHLREMDDLRTSVQQARHEQKDPLLIYKLESFKLFQMMMEKVNKDIISFLVRAQIPLVEKEEQAPNYSAPAQTDVSKLQTGRTEIGSSTQQNQEAAARQQGGGRSAVKQAPEVREERKIGRNEKVKVLNIRSGETKEVKFKQAEPMVASGQWQLVEN